jgi:phospholipase C/uncharacterized protein YjdB
VAIVSNALGSYGLATSSGLGTATISATSGSISNSTPITVASPALVSIVITPASAAMPLGTSQQFAATGTYTDGTSQDITATVTWSSSTPAVAPVSATGFVTASAFGNSNINATSGTVTSSASVTVTAPILVALSVSPATASIAKGTSQQFTATGTYSDGSTQNLTTTLSWSSSALTVATISGGTATGTGVGGSTISASVGSMAASAALTVTPPVLLSISVTPTAASVAAGYTQQFAATGTYSDGTTQNLTSVTWTSSSMAAATVSSAGLATSLTQGSSTITATSGTLSGSAALSVTPPVLTSLSVAPSTASIAKGTTQQFTATGTYSDNSTQDLTSTANWSSSSTDIATVTSGGLAAGAGIGSATITATSGSITASATLTVGQPTLLSIAVTPANPSFALGTTLPVFATGTYSDGSTLDLTATATWTTTDSTIAVVNTPGVATSVAVGSTTVTATSGTITGSTTITVTPAVLLSIAVTPAIPAIPLGTTQQFTATGTYTDGSMQNITSTVQWSSDTLDVATITAAGIASSLEQGTANITATSGPVSGTTALTVSSAALVSLAVTPAAPSIALGTMQQFTATGTFTDGTLQNLTSTVAWSSDTPATATINNAGLAQSLTIGTANVTATSGAVSSSTQLTVTPAALVSIAITPPTASIPLGTTQQFTATGTFTDGTTQDLTQTGSWSSTAAGVATISNTAATAGLASTLGIGTTTIGVSSGSVSATATLLVNPAVLASIAITPLAPTIPLGTAQQFTATGTYTDGSMQNLTSVATWSSSDATVAIVSNALGSYGLATSSGLGTATISATSGSISNSTSITVGGPTLSSIAVTPSLVSIALGYGEQFTATATYSDGSTADITQSATWSSSAPLYAAVNSTGYASSILPGSATISASSGSVTGTAQLVVNPAVPISLLITPATASVFIGAQQQFNATLYYSNGSSFNVTSTVTWSSLNPAVATVSSAGLAVGVTSGSSTIQATWGTNQFLATGGLTILLPTVSVTPAAASIALSSTQQFTATVTGSNNQSVTWNVDGVAGGNSTIGTISAAGLYSAPQLIGSHSITAVAQADSASQGSTTITVGTLAPVLSTFFGMHLHLATSPVPGTMAGTGRVWDSASAQWPNLNTASGKFTWTNLDSVLADYKTAGINDVLYTLWRVPTWASSNPNDTSCDYAASLGPKYYGECDLPTDINADGTGTNLTWRTWVQNIAQYVNNPTYLATHAHIHYWEPCNECYRSPTLDPGYDSGGNVQVAYKGTYAQLLRLMQDARCIILGNPNDAITALNTTCGQAGYPVIGIDPTAQMVMPSSSPLQVGKNPSYPQVTQNMLYCTCANNSCSASTTGCTTGSAGSAAVDIISAHIYPNSYTPEQIPSEIAKVRAVLSATDLAKPFWDGEGGWGQTSIATQVNDGDPDLEAAFVARFLLMNWAAGASRTYWYQWDNAAYGTLWNPTSNSDCTTPFTSGYICKAGTAYQQVYDWLVGSTLGDCSVNGTVWTCTLTESNGSPAAIIWDTSQTCSNGSCSSKQQSVSQIYESYNDLTGASYSINGTVAVGIKPILLQTQAVLTSISVTPSATSVPAGYPEQFTATGTYSNGATQNLTSTAIWTSSSTSIATVSSGGLAASVAQGSTTITAKSGTISGSATLTVTAPALASISVAPTTVSVTIGSTQQFAATGTYSNGTTQNLTASVTWTSSNSTVATISNSAGSQGVASVIGSGTATITATSGSVVGTANLTVTTAGGSISNFQHVIVVVQENRTPDNLFQGLCSAPYGASNSCSTSPTGLQYDIQTSNWLDNTSSTGTTQPVPVALDNDYDPSHAHIAFTTMCDAEATGTCRMDGAAGTSCTGTCPTRPQFAYTDNSTGILDPYLTLATQYGWGNYMFQTNQGPSFPSHQFLFGGTSAPSTADDAEAIFVAENVSPNDAVAGCTALATTFVELVGPEGENQTLYPPIYPCLEHETMADLFDSIGVSWRYYTPGSGSIWTAPNAIQHICLPNAPTGGECVGSDWTNDVIINPAQVLTDIGNCQLPGVSWVIPGGQNSDHPNSNEGGGPSWVASIVNAVGTNPVCKDGEVYWNNTAILVTWDDWGGWYDHEPPTILGEGQGDYQYGFRVPFIVVSAYTPAAYIDNNRMDFGTILRFVERNFGFAEGTLNFADARAQYDLTEFFDLNQAPRTFQTIPAALSANFFLQDKRRPTDPDDY